MASGDVLLMDVGAEYVGYAADVTRTIPVNGKFSRLQLDLYEIVLKAQEEAIKVMKPGKRFMDFHNKSSDIIVKGLFRLGLMTDTTKTWQKNVFILYRAGHYLGLNVHDVGRYGEDISVFRPGPGRELVAGMVAIVSGRCLGTIHEQILVGAQGRKLPGWTVRARAHPPKLNLPMLNLH
jgi:Xaa-Pro aminopeptidase